MTCVNQIFGISQVVGEINAVNVGFFVGRVVTVVSENSGYLVALAVIVAVGYYLYKSYSHPENRDITKISPEKKTIVEKLVTDKEIVITSVPSSVSDYRILSQAATSESLTDSIHESSSSSFDDPVGNIENKLSIIDEVSSQTSMITQVTEICFPKDEILNLFKVKLSLDMQNIILNFLPLKMHARLARINKYFLATFTKPKSLLENHKFLHGKWQEAKEKKDGMQFLTLLKTGYVPFCINKLVPAVVVESKETINCTPLELLFMNKTWDYQTIDAANLLVSNGAILPKPTKTTLDAYSSFDDLRGASLKDLFIVLRGNPDLIHKKKDSHTLLHNAVYWVSTGIDRRVFHILFTSLEINFNIIDSVGNTPLHTAGIFAQENRDARDYLFPTYVEEAIKQKDFDWTIRGQGGQTILHYAARISPRSLNMILKSGKIKEDALDILSDSGSTALFYCVDSLKFESANALLEAGANPLLYGNNQERSPLARARKHIQSIENSLRGKDPSLTVASTLEDLRKLEARLQKK